MIVLNLETKSGSQRRIKAYLEQNASEVLAEKINNGVRIEKDGTTAMNTFSKSSKQLQKP